MSMAGPDVIVIGGSAGGMRALQAILQTFDHPHDSVICVVLHRAPMHSPLAQVLQGYTAIPVHEPSTSPWPCPVGAVTVAPAGYHLVLGNGRELSRQPQTPLSMYRTTPSVRAHLTLDTPVAYSRPSLDVTFESAARLVNPVIAVLLSCASEDGARGCAAVKAAGGRVVIQDPVSCEAPIAVNAARKFVQPDHVADPQAIGTWLARAVQMP
jgi:two-component system, chemotaxis family, protein-glutamate methylesterase/glutaminase